jgi:hypothetical protein
MKKLYFIMLLSAIGGLSASVNAQIVNIPDAHFYNALLSNGINDSAGYITADTAKLFTGLLVLGSDSIADLTGIQAFTAITGLDCSDNLLTSVNLSANTLLTQLDCSINSLTALNLSSNTMLDYLYCNDDNISSMDLSSDTNLVSLQCESGSFTSLDLSHNNLLQTLLCDFNSITSLTLPSPAPYLTTLSCDFNSIKSLNVSADTALIYLGCEYDSLTRLNVKNGHNQYITGSDFSATNNPNLTCIEVDNVAYSNTNWLNKDAGASYSTDCVTAGVNEIAAVADVNIYPNPVRSLLTIETAGQKGMNINIYNMLGETVNSQYTSDAILTIDMHAAPAGIYFVQIIDAGKNILYKKIIKQ